MAIQTRQMAQLQDAYVSAQYDDTDMIVTRALWANLNPFKVRIVVIKQATNTVLLDTVVAAGTPEQSRNLSGPQRFNIDTDPRDVSIVRAP